MLKYRIAIEHEATVSQFLHAGLLTQRLEVPWHAQCAEDDRLLLHAYSHNFLALPSIVCSLHTWLMLKHRA